MYKRIIVITCVINMLRTFLERYVFFFFFNYRACGYITIVKKNVPIRYTQQSLIKLIDH